MKTWKEYFGVVIIIFVFAFIGCDSNRSNCVHEWTTWNETIPPTATENGTETRICNTCGAIETRQGADALATPFFGTWVSEISPSNTVTFSADLWIFVNPGIGTGTLANLQWANAINTSAETLDEFPFGFSISGTWIAHSDAQFIGNNLSFTWFINADKSKLLQSGTTWVWGD